VETASRPLFYDAAGLMIKHPGAQAMPHLGCSLNTISVIPRKSSFRSAWFIIVFKICLSISYHPLSSYPNINAIIVPEEKADI
jgi:hypothetical protein